MRIRYLLLAGAAALVVALALPASPIALTGAEPGPDRVRSTSSPKASVQGRAARAEYFHWMLRDPALDRIPNSARARELAFAESIPTAAARGGGGLTWTASGPFDVSGRNRSIVIDRADATGNTLLSGGVSGGLYRTTDAGQTWTLVSPPATGVSVTSIAQDVRAGQTNTFYYATGEQLGSAFNNTNSGAFYSGDGMFKSTDGGQTWARLAATLPGTPGTTEDGAERWDYVNRVAVSPTTGTVFTAQQFYGIDRSADGGTSFATAIDGLTTANGGSRFSDVNVSAGGVVLAAVSGTRGAGTAAEPGLYISYDDGATWQDVTPGTFPVTHERSVIAFSGETAYIMTYTGADTANGQNDDVRLHHVVVTPGGGTPPAFQDRTANLPLLNTTGPGAVAKVIDTQGNYNMIVEASPVDADLVMIGATNLFVSTDGFATATDVSSWAGGYDAQAYLQRNFPQYPNHHPDNHAIAFDPTTRTKVWSGHDGGISLTNDVTATNANGDGITWERRERGFDVTQFYHGAISPETGRMLAVGGTQDNGTPTFRLGDTTTPSGDGSSGDGANAFIGRQFIFVQSQNGNMVRYATPAPGGALPTFGAGTFTQIPNPQGASGQLFINPIAVDPNNEANLFYPAGNTLWRSTTANGADGPAIAASWAQIPVTGVNTYAISALTVGAGAPQGRLWVAYFSPGGAPLLRRIDDAGGTATVTDISIPGAAVGAWTGNIAVNETDSNEAIVTLANYNVVGTYHTADGGATWTAIEGNLTGTAQNLGPSIRSATIVPAVGNRPARYLLATSTGVYSATALNGANTAWTQEGAGIFDNIQVAHITSRSADGVVVAFSHGRATYMAQVQNPVATGADGPEGWALAAPAPNPIRERATVRYRLAEAGTADLAVFDMAGRRVAVLADGDRAAGPHQATFQTAGLAAGTYVVRLQSGGQTLTRSAVVVR